MEKERAGQLKGKGITIAAIVVILVALAVVWAVDRRINPGLVMALGLLVVMMLASRRGGDGADRT